MLRLDLITAPRWIDLARGVRVEVLPFTTTLSMAVHAELAERGEEGGLAFAKAVAAQAIVAWEGVGDEAGKPIPVSPEGTRALMEVPPIFRAFRSKYIDPSLLEEAEGNGSAAAPSGGSAAA